MYLDQLFPQVDEKATINKVKHFFKVTLPSMERHSHKDVSGMKSPVISDMPRGGSVGNQQEETITRRIYAGQVVDECRKAIECCDAISQQILWSVYVKDNTVMGTQLESGYGETRFRYYKNRACLQFADAFMLEDLHVFQK
ncbi:ArpU family phage packaging/lysis transcriptional regulator [Latilactobacillus sakei]|uniref:ArpU family phage packaging/lysis transcriptional regulator n=1 Tax=Latilactobacillus sakei TaxID=1599 RepID=A0AAF0GM25_LATSK|nr:ArpU family phage packaging/lysis transcriptional regulator [Latilactobacillus sakei]WGI18569.1 ArpU family phage packaging/lysis transcriptional regulator [Latilactobacillus sakei]